MAETGELEVREDSGDSFIKSLEAPDVEGEGEVKVEEIDVDEDGRIVKVAEGKVSEEEEGVKTEDGEKKEVAVVSPDTTNEKELSELRALAREQRKELAVLKESVGRMNKVQQEEFGDDTHTAPGELEKLQQDIQTIQTERKNFLEEAKSLMELNPKFEDIDSVITSRRVSDIIELAAKNLAPKYSKDEVSMGLIIEKNIWSMPNPYKYLYELITENHPDFVKKEVVVEGGEGEGEKKITEEEIKRSTSKVTTEKKPVITPTTISTVSSGNQNNGGWTSARIDDMPEAELSKVPRDIYTAYLAGDLP